MIGLLIFGLFFHHARAQIEMHGTDRKNESLVDTKKERRKAIAEAFAQESKVARSLKKAQGDRAEITKACPVPSAWRPTKSSVETAREWDIVPFGIISKTYPRNSGVPNDNDLKTEFETAGEPEIEKCDFITVKFKGDHVDSIDNSKCEEPETMMDSYRECHHLLKNLSQKSRKK